MSDTPTDGSAGLSFEQAKVILDTAVNPFVLMAADGTVLWASASIEELLGHAPSAIVGMPMLELVAPESQADAISALADALADRSDEAPPEGWEGVGPVYAMRRADGSTVSCAVAVATPVRTGFDCFVLQLRRSNATAALERLHLSMGTGEPLEQVLSLVAAVLEGELPDADVVLFRWDREQKRLLPTSTKLTIADHHDLPEMLGRVWDQAEARLGEVTNLSVDELPPAIAEVARAAGYHWVVMSPVAPLTDEDRAGMVTVWSRTLHRTHMLNHERVIRCGRLMGVALKNDWGRQALEWAATHDLLTGLPNQAAFEQALSDVRHGHRRTDRASVLYLDLDDFKPVNDAHGHLLGNRVLMRIADRLRSLVRPTDLVARVGGDEFAVLCPGVDDAESLAKLAQRLVDEVRQPIEVDGTVVEVGLSVGIASARSDDDLDTVVVRADSALREAKRTGKSRWSAAP